MMSRFLTWQKTKCKIIYEKTLTKFGASGECSLSATGLTEPNIFDTKHKYIHESNKISTNIRFWIHNSKSTVS